jgi:hypothetical protein
MALDIADPVDPVDMALLPDMALPPMLLSDMAALIAWLIAGAALIAPPPPPPPPDIPPPPPLLLMFIAIGLFLF